MDDISMKNYFTNIISCHFSRLANGMLSANDPALIEWGSPVGIGWNSVNDINYPALATAGTEVVVTFEEGMSALKYALGKILLQYENGTLVKGSSDKVYVVLNQYRYWIPDPATFDALGYDWGELYWLSDNELNTVSEGGALPSVAPQSGPLSFPNSTLLQGSSEKVYVMLNDYRYWIPDSVTLSALG